jgi:hypothetical protein
MSISLTITLLHETFYHFFFRMSKLIEIIVINPVGLRAGAEPPQSLGFKPLQTFKKSIKFFMFLFFYFFIKWTLQNYFSCSTHGCGTYNFLLVLVFGVYKMGHRFWPL